MKHALIDFFKSNKLIKCDLKDVKIKRIKTDYTVFKHYEDVMFSKFPKIELCDLYSY